VRADLPIGAQIAQTAHASIEFSMQWHSLARSWMDSSNNLVVVAVPDELALAELITQAVEEGIAHTIVREPDFGNSITAVALEAGKTASRLCANMPCAGRVLVPT
jgi:peptidyl-tRNA hydrolase